MYNEGRKCELEMTGMISRLSVYMEGRDDMHYVIGDVHGCYSELMALLDKIESQDAEAQIIFVGDWVDRGSEQKQVLDWMMEHITEDGKYQSVRGNHDEDAWEWYKGEYEPWRKWNPECEKELSQPPYSNYNFYEVVQNEYKHDLKQLEPLIDKLHNLPYNKLVEVESRNHKKVKYRIAHAWHEHRDDVSKWSKIEANLYVRKYAIGNRDNPEEIYVHGHTPTIVENYYFAGNPRFERPGMISYRENAINVDGGCCFLMHDPFHPCMLCGICLETLEEFYCDTLENRLRMGIRHYLEEHPDKVGEEGFEATLERMVQEKRVRYDKVVEDRHRINILKRLGERE